MSAIELRPIRIDTTSADVDGRLVMFGGGLVGVLVRLAGEEQAPLQGYWHLEAGFGPLDGMKCEPFETLDEATAWIGRKTRPTLPCST